MEGLTEGRIVHFVATSGEHRPAIIVRVWRDIESLVADSAVNLQVFTDGRNDMKDFGPEGAIYGTAWRTSVTYSAEPKIGTWHWIEKA